MILKESQKTNSKEETTFIFGCVDSEQNAENTLLRVSLNMIPIKKWTLFCFILTVSIGLFPACLQSSEFVRSELVDIQSVIPNIQIELKYATKENFTGEIVYNFSCCLLLKEAALKLRDVQDELELLGLGLKVWDGFRPVSAQWFFWQLMPDERYVSDPRKGGRHTRGTAVDLTLVTKEGKELLMPSNFDDFSEKAHQDYMGACHEAIENRELLREVMERHGFENLCTQWWHFDLIGWENRRPFNFIPQ